MKCFLMTSILQHVMHCMCTGVSGVSAYHVCIHDYSL